jgi:hypothetical protein
VATPIEPAVRQAEERAAPPVAPSDPPGLAPAPHVPNAPPVLPASPVPNVSPASPVPNASNASNASIEPTTAVPETAPPVSLPTIVREGDLTLRPPAATRAAPAAAVREAAPVPSPPGAALPERPAAARAPLPSLPAEDPTAEALLPIAQDAPDVPRRLCAAGDCERGIVIAYRVREDGRVASARVLAGGNPALNRLLVDTVLRWRFAPLSRGPRDAQVLLSLRDP